MRTHCYEWDLCSFILLIYKLGSSWMRKNSSDKQNSKIKRKTCKGWKHLKHLKCYIKIPCDKVSYTVIIARGLDQANRMGFFQRSSFTHFVNAEWWWNALVTSSSTIPLKFSARIMQLYDKCQAIGPTMLSYTSGGSAISLGEVGCPCVAYLGPLEAAWSFWWAFKQHFQFLTKLRSIVKRQL